jgi:hypothetical protein
MTFEIFSSLKSHIIRWPRHLLMAGGLCLLVACGGGGGGTNSSTTASTPTPSLENASVSPFMADAPIFLKPTYQTGTAVIAWKNSRGTTGEIPVLSSGALIQHNPSLDTTYTLVVTYQDPSKVTPTFIAASSNVISVQVTAQPLPATYLKTSDNTLTNGRNDHASVRLPANGKVLVCGGTDGIAALKTCEIFNPSSNKWEATGSMSVARLGHTMTLLTNNKVLIVGGYDGKKLSFATAEIYDTSTGQFTVTTSPMSATRWKHTATLLPDGKVLIAGGILGPTNIAAQETTELYDPTSGSFTPHTLSTATTGLALREARIGHTATLLPNNKILFLGNEGENTGVAKILNYNSATPTDSTWETITAPSYTQYKRASHTTTLVKDPSAIIGGFPTGNASSPDTTTTPNATTNVITSEVLVVGGSTAFDQSKITERLTVRETSTATIDNLHHTTTVTVTTYLWEKMDPLPVNRSSHSAQLMADGNRVLISGGFDGTTALNTIDIYAKDLTDGIWKSTRNVKIMNEARAQHTSNLVGLNGAILITGNRSGGITKTSEIWEP